MKKVIFFTLIPFLLLSISCNRTFRSSSAEYRKYTIRQSQNHTKEIDLMIKPYSDSINKSMNDVIGDNELLLEKKSKKNSLGFFMADAFLYMAKIKFKQEVDAAFMNHGGIRLDELQAGKISRGTIFELMPFDNLLLIQKVKGKVLKQYLDSLASGGGIIQSGLFLTIQNRRAENVLVGGKPLEENKDYVIANSDYIINGSEVLKLIPSQNIGYLQRDAIIEYVSSFTQKGEKVIVVNINRVHYVE